MANREHLEIFKQGAEEWNTWRKENPTIQPDLSKVIHNKRAFSQKDLSDTDLSETDLSEADLSGVNFSAADLTHADLGKAYLNGANLSWADLSDATLSWAYLREANLQGATLSRTQLHGADLRKANLQGAHITGGFLTDAFLSGADLSHANLSYAFLHGVQMLNTNLTKANITGCSIFGLSAWGVQLEGAIQKDLVITPSDEPRITVDDLEVAQFIYLILNHKKLRNALNSVTEKGVLLLGRFSHGGLATLQAVAVKLRELGYLPIVFDFDRPNDRDYTETVKTLVGLSRFVIVEMSGPSVPQELYSTVPHFDVPFVPIIEKGKNSYAMSKDLWKYPWFLNPPVEFTDKKELIELVPTAIVGPAEERHRERQKLLDKIFNH